MKRTPLARTKPIIAAGPATAKIKLRKCAICRDDFLPRFGFEKWCSPAHGYEIHARSIAKKAAKAQRDDKRQTRANLEAIKTIPKLIAEAQAAFNKFIRLRDDGKPCIVCKTPLQIGGVGGGFDAGHVRARSAAGHLRFDETNVHGQCKRCNAPGGTLPHVMRAAAIQRIGEAAYLALENNNTPHKWGRDELRAIRDTYRQQARQRAAQSAAARYGLESPATSRPP